MSGQFPVSPANTPFPEDNTPRSSSPVSHYNPLVYPEQPTGWQRVLRPWNWRRKRPYVRPQAPPYDPQKPEASINNLYAWTIARAHQQIEWYSRKARHKKYGSKTVRMVSSVLAALGALMPLLSPLVSDQQTILGFPLSELPQLGYILLAVAGALYGIDRTFGTSSGWLRFMEANLSLLRLLNTFQHKWVVLRCTYGRLTPEEPTACQALAEALQTFSDQVDALVVEETQTWIRDFKTRIADFEKKLDEAREETKPSAIHIRIENALTFTKVDIALGDYPPLKQLKGTTETLLKHLPPDTYHVRASGERGGEIFQADTVATVTPGTTTQALLTLRKVSHG